MAIYHFSAKVIGRSQGRSAVASAAYRAAARLYDDKLGRDHDYTAKAGVVHSEVLLPAGAPERWADRGTLWNEVEAGERRRDAQLARDIEIALPRELSRTEAIQLARDFVREEFVARGMVADLNVHWGWTTNPGRDAGADREVGNDRDADLRSQPHAHVMLTMREVVPGRDGPDGPEEARFGRKVVAWNDRDLLRGWRERWAELANQRLHELGHDVRIDHRSYRDQGIELEPQHKIGPAGARREERGEHAERAAEHRAIARGNGEKLLADPAIALRALTQQHSTFTRQDLARFVDRHTEGAGQFTAVLARVEAAPELVRLGEDGRGRQRFTTREMLEAEQRLEEAGVSLAGRDGHGVSTAAAQRAKAEADRAGPRLGAEQEAALRHVTDRGDLALVVGYAGTGKSAMLGVARAAWQAEGYRVQGLALSGIAAEGLQAGSGIASRTLASLEFAWSQGKDGLTGRDVLVVDEAGMVGSRQMERVLSAAERAGAKVVLVGDPEQLQAIEAGAAFRALAERHGAAEITAVRRQHADWQREATKELATGRTETALERYAAAGMVREAGSREEARAALVDGWETARQAAPGESQMILAYTRDDVVALNDLARERMRDAGVLRGPDQAVRTERGQRVFAAGDRLMFLRNERGLGADARGQGGVAVKNGTLGTVLEVAAGGERLTVRLDGAGGPGGSGKSNSGQEKGDEPAGRVVTFQIRDYAHVDHGYAATIHKAQGVTVDRAHVLATPHMDRHAAYVGLTRHREAVTLHYAREDFADPARLARALGRERAKDTTLDYREDRAIPAGPVPPAGRVPGRDRNGEDALVRRYAERRGLGFAEARMPESRIVVRPERAGLDTDAGRPAKERAEVPVKEPRRSRFAGLRLESPRSALGRAQEGLAPGSRVERAATEPQAPETPQERLARGLEVYARAWSDAGRMHQQGLPVLPHQARTLEQAGQALDAIAPDLARDTRAALERAPELAVARDAPAAGRTKDTLALAAAIGAARRDRLALDERGRAAVRAWQALEQAYETAGKDYDWQGQREVGERLEAFAKELKRDPQLDSLLRQRGRDLGVGEGSRLDRVVRAPEPELDRTLRRELHIRSGPSLGLGM